MIRVNLCQVCARRRGTVFDPERMVDVATCDAFPEGIPGEILGGADHRRGWPGDDGKRFVSIGTDFARQHIAHYDEIGRRMARAARA